MTTASALRRRASRRCRELLSVLAGRRRLRRPTFALVLIVVFCGLCGLYSFFQDDKRFYARVDTYIPPDVEYLGIEAIEGQRAVSLVDGDTHIPKTLWQLYFTPSHVWAADSQLPEEQRKWVGRWKRLNRDHEYRLVRDDEALQIVRKYVTKDTPFYRVLTSTEGNPAVRSDLLRYLILYFEGGVYADTDTIPVWPIKDWIPKKYRDETRVVVGIEFDRLAGKNPRENWPGVHHDMQFCQWTISAAPGHPLFTTMATRAMVYLEQLMHERGVTKFEDLKLTPTDVLTTTGPSAWTDALFHELRARDSSIQHLTDLALLKEERLFGDILVLPVDGFGMGQRHSGSTRGKTPAAARVKHKFRGLWRKEKDLNVPDTLY